MTRGSLLLATFALSPVALLAEAAVAGTPAERGPAIYRGASTAVRFDISPPLRNQPILPEPLCEVEPVCEADQDITTAVVTGPDDADPVVQTTRGEAAIPPPNVSFDTITGSARPPDPVGAVGPNHYVVMGNVKFGIYTKTGTLINPPGIRSINTLWSGFGGPCETQNAGDPVVVHDQQADRWLLSQFTASGPPYYNCVAVSTSPDPTSTYYRYAFASASGTLPDYPKYGVWPDAYYNCSRELSSGIGAYAFERAAMLAGSPTAQSMSFLVALGSVPRYQLGDGWLPADWDGPTPPPAGSPNYFLGTMDTSYNSAPQDALYIWEFHVDWTTPANSTFTYTATIPTAAFDSNFPCSGRACIPQPGTAQKIDILGYRQRPTFRNAYRNFGTHESLVTNQSVEAATAMAGARWYELRDPGGTPSIFQQGTYAPGVTDGIHRWMGSICQDQNGNMALGFSASDATATYPSVWYAGRLATDPLGQMSQGEDSFVDGSRSQTDTSGRWGDYTAMTIDPTDDCTFWYVNEYYVLGSNPWRLRVGSFKFPSCAPPPTTTVNLITGPGPGQVNPANVKGWKTDGTSNGITNFTSYAANQFGSNVALGEIRTPSTPAADILTGAGPGAVYGPQVRGFAKNGTSIAKINYYAYGTLKYGVNVNSGGVDGDAYEEILTAPGPGAVFGPHIRGWNFDNVTLTSIAKISYFAYNTLKYGAQVAGANIDTDAFSEILTGPGPSGAFGSTIRAFNFDASSITSIGKINFNAYTFSYGVHVTGGDLDSDGIEEILSAPGPAPTATSRVHAYNYDGASLTAIAGVDFDGITGAARYGATVDSVDLDADSYAEIVVGTGYDATNGGPHLKGWNWDGSAVTGIVGLDFDAYATTQRYGVNVAVDDVGP